MAVPEALYKVILVTEAGRSHLIAVMMPNAETGDRSLESFILPAAAIEMRTGLTFFPGLDGNR